jgi:hypothetical protein
MRDPTMYQRAIIEVAIRSRRSPDAALGCRVSPYVWVFGNRSLLNRESSHPAALGLRLALATTYRFHATFGRLNGRIFDHTLVLNRHCK